MIKNVLTQVTYWPRPQTCRSSYGWLDKYDGDIDLKLKILGQKKISFSILIFIRDISHEQWEQYHMSAVFVPIITSANVI